MPIPKLTFHVMAVALLLAGGNQTLFAEIKVEKFVIRGEVFDLYRVQRYKSGQVKRGTLQYNKTLSIGGEDYTFKGGTLSQLFFYKSGRIHKGELGSYDDKTVSIGGTSYTFMGGTYVSFYESGSPKSGTIASNQSVSIGGEDYFIKGWYNTKVSFYESGKVKQAALGRNKTVSIGGEDYTFASNRAINFHPSGQVRNGRLAVPITFSLGGTTYQTKKHSSLWFDGWGAIKGAGFLVPTQVHLGKDKPLITSFRYTEDYQLIQFHLAEDATIQGKPYKAGTVIRLTTDGTVAGSSNRWDNHWTGQQPNKPADSE